MQIYNSLNRRKEEFEPLSPGKVGLYACGVTVYDLCHIGHARSLVVFDVIYRYLRYRGYEVTFVRNFTDIDDKIINRSNERGISWKELADKYIDEFYVDMDRLGLLRPTVEPRATDHIGEIIALVRCLEEKGLAYEVDGDVYYRLQGFKGYGKLSGKNVDDLLSGARVEVDDRKESPLDFALWKKSKPGEPSWPSPWGEGRPGWHIECSAMSQKYLGETFDIHGGGKDLIFPHHENEIAQSEGATGKPLARFWVHNGFVNIDQEKMSKSLGNFLTIRELLEEVHPEVLRFFVISSHYRSPIDFSKENVAVAAAGLERLYQSLERLDEKAAGGDPGPESPLDERLSIWRQEFIAAMDDDFNSAAAVAVLFEASKEINRWLDEAGDGVVAPAAARVAAAFRELGQVLGLFSETPDAFLQRSSGDGDELAAEEIEKLISERAAARKAKNWAEADRIRDLLDEQGVVLKDGPEGTRWQRKR
ncbi:MAG: cysteine--tRNA ligase [Deltaproteobacteria bacterium]|nr:cysteine--tRNA ligase [Deltaproteobacteria bacterium]